MQSGPTPAKYIRTAVALLALLIVTVAISYAPLGVLGLVIALGIAVAKSSLVGAYFMHVRYGPPIVRVFAIAGLIWLSLLFWLTLNDYLTRA